jgi:hypothetical protein
MTGFRLQAVTLCADQCVHLPDLVSHVLNIGGPDDREMLDAQVAVVPLHTVQKRRLSVHPFGRDRLRGDGVVVALGPGIAVRTVAGSRGFRYTVHGLTLHVGVDGKASPNLAKDFHGLAFSICPSDIVLDIGQGINEKNCV